VVSNASACEEKGFLDFSRSVGSGRVKVEDD